MHLQINYIKNQGSKHPVYHFLIILADFTVTYAVELAYFTCGIHQWKYPEVLPDVLPALH